MKYIGGRKRRDVNTAVDFYTGTVFINVLLENRDLQYNYYMYGKIRKFLQNELCYNKMKIKYDPNLLNKIKIIKI